jgi:hypothetical protein
MRFSSIIAAAALGASVVGATLVDICANINESLKVDLFGIEIVVGELGRYHNFSSLLGRLMFFFNYFLKDVCLCISAIPLFIESNIVAKAAVDLVGASSVEAELTSLVCIFYR